MASRQSELERTLRRKQALYARLDGSTKSEDDEKPDPGRQSSLRAMQKARTEKAVVENDAAAGNKVLPRSVSDTNLANKRRRYESSQSVPSTDPAESVGLPAALTTRHTFSGAVDKKKAITVASPPSTATKITGKRKRDAPIPVVPDEHQIFKRLHFYFFPNNDTNPARKLRISKALEYGATWEKTFHGGITHVIIDKTMDLKSLLHYLKRDNLPGHVKVVSEDYPPECISYRALLDPKLRQFKVKGYDQIAAARPASSNSDQSLPLKAAGKSVMARAPETPKRGSTPTPATSSRIHTKAPEALSFKCLGKEPVTKGVESNAEFDAAIRQVQELQYAPLDHDEDGGSRPGSADGPVTDEDEKQQSAGLQLIKKRKTKLQAIQQKFQCMHKHTGPDTENPNAATISILQQMADYYGKMGDEWRTRAYRKAIGTLRNHPTKVMTKEKAFALPQIGERLATKIEEIAFSSRLRRLENAKAEPTDQILQTFMQVYGAGYAVASKWVSAGFTTLDKVLQMAELTDNQRVGIEHYADFNSRIPRAEVQQHGELVRNALQAIDPAFEVIIGGSYRRGASTSGDIDCIITRPNTGLSHIRDVVLDQLVPQLFAHNFLVAELAATSRQDGSKWHGASRLPSLPNFPSAAPNPWRRIDLLLVPSDELGAALIYFTGNDIFNRSMRLLASTKGMRLNQRGLYRDVIRGAGREKLSEGTLVEGRDEKAIFEALAVPWRPPEHRNC